MRRLTLIAVCTFVFTGCVFLHEPYPGWTMIDLPYNDLPRKVKMGFRHDFGDAHVTRVERSTFESRVSGHPKKYQIFFEKPDAEVQRVIYDPRGKRVDGFDFWFDEKWRVPN